MQSGRSFSVFWNKTYIQYNALCSNDYISNDAITNIDLIYTLQAVTLITATLAIVNTIPLEDTFTRQPPATDTDRPTNRVY